MKNIHKLLSLTLLLSSSCTLAFQHQPKYYIAGNLGIFQANFNNTYNDQTDAIAENIEQPVNQQGYTGGLAIGYRQFCNNMMLGGEFLVNVDGNTATFASGAAGTSFNDKNQVRAHADLTFTPGMMLTQTLMGYFKLGLSVAYIQDRLVSPVGYTPSYDSVSSNKYVPGLAAGIGVSQALCHNLSIFTEANYHDYGTVNFDDFDNFTSTYSHNSHIYSYDVVVGLSYLFA